MAGIALRTETRKLPCKMTDTEVQLAGMELAGAYEAVQQEEESQKETKAALATKLKGLRLKVGDLAYKVSHREEKRDVDVAIKLDPKTMTVEEVRTDTGEIIRVRKAQDDEMQTSFDEH